MADNIKEAFIASVMKENLKKRDSDARLVTATALKFAGDLKKEDLAKTIKELIVKIEQYKFHLGLVNFQLENSEELLGGMQKIMKEKHLN